MNFQSLYIALISMAVPVMNASCVKKSQSDLSKPLAVRTTLKADLTGKAGNPEALCDYLDAEGYVKGYDYSEKTQVAYSTSYGTDSETTNGAEAGQAHGYIMSNGRFYQANLVTTQALVCEGSFSGFSNGECLWQIGGKGGYAELAHKIVCNKAANYGSKGRLHPGYTSMKVSNVELEASTAGKTFTHTDTVRVDLEGPSLAAVVYFGKDKGLVAAEYREKALVSGTSKVYIGAK